MGRTLGVLIEDDKVQNFFVRKSGEKILLQKHGDNIEINIARSIWGVRSELILVHKKSTAIPVVDGNKFLSSYKEGNGLTTCKF